MAAALVGVVGFSVAQPLYDALRRSGSFLVAHQADFWDVAALGGILSLVLPLGLFLLVLLARAIDRRLGRMVFLLLLGVGAGVLALTVARSLAAGAWFSVGAAGLVATVAVRLGRQHGGVRLLALLGLASLGFPLLFVTGVGLPLLRESGQRSAVEEVSEAPAIEVPVVLVVFDELPTASLVTAELEIDAERFPNFGRLAAISTWYRQATTVALTTTHAVPALLSGRYPLAEDPRGWRQYGTNLLTFLGPSTRVNSWETVTSLCPPTVCAPPKQWFIPRRERLPSMLQDLGAIALRQAVPAAWSRRLPAVDGQWRDFWSAGTVASRKPRPKKARRKHPVETFGWFLNAIEQQGTKPAIHFAHVILPHRPWIWLPSGQSYASHAAYDHGLVEQFWRGSEWETTQAQQRHLLTVGLVDRFVGRLLDSLERVGILDQSLVIVVADHGGAFATGEARRGLYREPGVYGEARAEIVGVPLFVKYPGQSSGTIDDRNAETIDVAATIFEILETPPPWVLDGRTLDGPPAAKGPLKRTYRTANRSQPGTPLLYRFDQLRDWPAAVTRIATRFGPGDWRGLFDAGPHRELLGRRPSEVGPVTAGSGWSAAISGREELESADFDPDAEVLPIHLHAVLTAAAAADAEPEAVVVVVNDEICASTETYRAADGALELTALLPPWVLRNDPISLQLFGVTDGATGYSLRALPLLEATGVGSAP